MRRCLARFAIFALKMPTQYHEPAKIYCKIFLCLLMLVHSVPFSMCLRRSSIVVFRCCFFDAEEIVLCTIIFAVARVPYSSLCFALENNNYFLHVVSRRTRILVRSFGFTFRLWHKTLTTALAGKTSRFLALIQGLCQMCVHNAFAKHWLFSIYVDVLRVFYPLRCKNICHSWPHRSKRKSTWIFHTFAHILYAREF